MKLTSLVDEYNFVGQRSQHAILGTILPFMTPVVLVGFFSLNSKEFFPLNSKESCLLSRKSYAGFAISTSSPASSRRGQRTV